MTDFGQLWVEKYRPHTLNEVLLSKNVREFFETILKQDGIIPHLLLHGGPGCGKTSIALILVKEVLKCEYLYLNASDQNGVDTIRGIVKNFIETKSYDGKIKVVILDEADALSMTGGTGSSAQSILRNMMEEYSQYVRFILTCNYGHKIIEPIWSRTQAFYICPDRKEYVQRCLTILKTEGVKVTSEATKPLMTLINDSYPDLRKAINEIQKCSITGTFITGDNIDNEIKNISNTCFNMLTEKVDINLIRKYIIENETTFKGNYNLLLKNLFENVYASDFDQQKKAVMLLCIGEALVNNQIVLDREINFFCCIIKLSKI